MSRKRRNTSSPEPDDLPSPKRLDTHDAQDVWDETDEEDIGETPYVAQYSGQTGAFPGLGGDSDELFYGPAADGIDYLRMVRSEAKGVPYILTAPLDKAKDGSSQHAEDGGYYYDGAYTAVAKVSATEVEPTSPAQEYYYDSLLTQFRLVQATMRCTPPLSSLETLASSQFISFPESSRKVRAQWEAHVLSCDPHPAQVACFDQETVFELVKFFRMKLITFIHNKSDSIVRRIGAWVWAILGKCRDRGELSSEDIAELRGLARRAVEILRKLEGGLAQDDAWSEDTEYEAADVQSAVDEVVATQKDVSETTTGAPNEGTETITVAMEKDMDRTRLIRMTLDMIITIVGEVYGQRDLLDLRRKWRDD
ncbi:hypothetical protein LTR47_007003 [Exophiala xenobiotica]|nr:hypothetical protein LTR41_001995 [Exophiala xenobiotica]KAK5231870.1 hypothetical protein LTR47_007003 [Exophiala xenobiotica]KAK5246268.1 hypothetical protein LTS06_008425 [Exophiala xenobiotica]KAK5327290.1 hypothetical protein LTR93_002674 [Exophiala xenobiotica]KAK5353686.1 hypothetical protein LTR61_002380 [Exophiala xenobiotica]